MRGFLFYTHIIQIISSNQDNQIRRSTICISILYDSNAVLFKHWMEYFNYFNLEIEKKVPIPEPVVPLGFEIIERPGVVAATIPK